MPYAWPSTVLFPAAAVGAAAGYEVRDILGVTVAARTTTGVVEVAPGKFLATVSLPTDGAGNFYGSIRWDAAGLVASEFVEITANAPALRGWPVAVDVSAMLTRAGITPPEPAILTALILEGIDAFETETNQRPFLAGAPSRRYFTPDPRGTSLLDLGAMASQVDFILLGGRVLAVSEYDARPDGEPDGPSDRIAFPSPVFGGPRSIEIIARWGAVSSVPSLASAAVAAYAAQAAAAEALSQTTGAGGGLVRVREGDVERQYQTYSSEERQAARKDWQETWKRGVQGCRLAVMA